jgi:hypothetical protein
MILFAALDGVCLVLERLLVSEEERGALHVIKVM